MGADPFSAANRIEGQCLESGYPLRWELICLSVIHTLTSNASLGLHVPEQICEKWIRSARRRSFLARAVVHPSWTLSTRAVFGLSSITILEAILHSLVNRWYRQRLVVVITLIVCFGDYAIVAGSEPSVGTFVDFAQMSISGSPASMPFGVHVSGDGVWFTTVGDHRILKATISPDGAQGIVSVAGTGQKGYSGDGGPATEARFNWPHEVRVDEQHNLFVADTRNHVIRRIDHRTSVISTLAGNGKPGFAGDGKSAGAIQFDSPHSIALDGDGGLLVADTKNHRLRRIDLQTGVVSTICGNGQKKLPTDGAPIATSPLFGPRSLAVDEDSIWLALREGNSIWRINRSEGTIHHIAGTGAKGYSGDGGPPPPATFRGPKGIALNEARQIAVVDTENHAVREIDLAAGTVNTVLGGRLRNQTMPMKRPHGIAFHGALGWLVADSENDRILFIRNR